MSVKIRLNNKNFFQSPMVIGSRLYEGEDTPQQPAANTQLQAQPTANANTQQTANTNTLQLQPTQQLQLGPTIDQEVNRIITEQFSQLVANVSQQLQALKLPEGVLVQWVKAELPKDQTLQSVWAVVQPFLVNNIKAVTTALQQKQGEQQLQQQTANQQNQQLTNTQQPASAQ